MSVAVEEQERAVEHAAVRTDAAPPAPLALRVNFSWTAAGNAFYALTQWLVLAAITKLVPPEAVGGYVLALAVTAPIMLFANMHLRTVQAADAGGVFRFSDFLSLRLTTTATGLGIIVAIALFAGFGRAQMLIIILIGLSKAVESFADIYYGALQKDERMDMVAKMIMAKGGATLVVVVALLLFVPSIEVAIVGLVAVWILHLFIYVRPAARKVGGSRLKVSWNGLTGDFESVRSLFVKCLPLGGVALLVSLLPNIPRYFVEGLLGSAPLGYFGALAYLIIAGQTVVNALGQASVPRLSKLYRDNRLHEVRSLLLKMLTLGLAVGGGGITVVWLLGEEILTIAYTAEYAQYHEVLLVLMMSGACAYLASLAWYAITALDLVRHQFRNLAIVTVLGVGVSYLLISSYGLEGAAAALGTTYFFQLVGYGSILYVNREKLQNIEVQI